jgi:hypothetical protein
MKIFLTVSKVLLGVVAHGSGYPGASSDSSSSSSSKSAQAETLVVCHCHQQASKLLLWDSQSVIAGQH